MSGTFDATQELDKVIQNVASPHSHAKVDKESLCVRSENLEEQENEILCGSAETGERGIMLEPLPIHKGEQIVVVTSHPTEYGVVTASRNVTTLLVNEKCQSSALNVSKIPLNPPLTFDVPQSSLSHGEGESSSSEHSEALQSSVVPISISAITSSQSSTVGIGASNLASQSCGEEITMTTKLLSSDAGMSVPAQSSDTADNSEIGSITQVEIWKTRNPVSSTSSPSTMTSTETKSLGLVTSAHSESPKHQHSEQLLNFAKKLIEEKGLGKTMTISTADDSKCIIRSEPEGSKPNAVSDSVITMYLSSPNELKDKLEKLNTNSPVIVMQAGEDLLSHKKEKAVEPDKLVPGEAVTMSVSTATTEAIVTSSSSESIVAALTSLTSKPVLYRCVECDYSSHNKHYYKQHVDLVHNTERPHKCPLCDYAGKRKHALLEHMVVHSNERPFICEHCNASFRKKGHLTNHIKLHTSQRLVQCSICQIQLPDTEAFEAHLRKIHNTDRLYKCRICELTLVDRDTMLKHLLTHSTEPSPASDLPASQNVPTVSHQVTEPVNNLSTRRQVGAEEKSAVLVEVKTEPGSAMDKDKLENQPIPVMANIVCSVCGFICADRNVMKSHMWEHLKKNQAVTSPLQEKNKSDEGSTMSVLKRNVNIGLKSLPDNVTYQCAACSFTSNDNSVFIKHMLAHKTQKKQQVEAKSSGVSEAGRLQPSVVITTVPSGQGSQEVKVTYSEVKSVQEPSAEPEAPFIYDKTAGRYRCVICGYHCEFQRTIKAHIWKHSGHQNIQYPMFDTTSAPQAAKPKRAATVVKEVNVDHIKHEVGSVAVKNVDLAKKLTRVPVLKTPSGELVPLMPLESVKANYDPKNIVQVKNNTVVVSANLDRTVGTTRIVESVSFSEVVSKPHVAVGRPTSVPIPGGPIREQLLVSAPKMSPQEAQKPVAVVEKSGQHVVSELVSTEPGVVVEIVDSVPSSFGLTGMKSQQGSPRVLDLDGSGSEASLIKLFSQARRGSGDSAEEEKVPPPTHREEKAESNGPNVVVQPIEQPSSQPLRLRCPKCDCLLLGKDELTSHLLVCSSAEDTTAPAEEVEPNVDQNRPPSAQQPASDQDDPLATEDSDATESSDEQSNPPGDASISGGQQKTGICSSLLAVIEQLRERSQSESDDSKPLSQSTRSNTVGRKRTRQKSDMGDLSPDDIQNIEKITDNGSDKYRCKLCHYTSQRICNMKLHMKTHRQKKPSECSLCDFSSDSPEDLQAHMLKHCKVRTYACKFCPQTFNHKSTLRAHLRAHKDQEPFLCAYCAFETTSPIEYREHMQVHSGCSSRLRCPLCDKISSNKEELTSHLMKCKGCRTVEKVEVEAEKSNSSVTKDSPKVSTATIGAPASTASSSLAPSQQNCVVEGCSFSCSSLKELQDHLSVHCNPSLLVCNLCDFKALHNRSLKSHMKRHANDQRYVQQPLEQYKCNLCGYVCHHLPSLKSHMWRHASDQSYSYEFTNDVINAAIDYDTRLDVTSGDADDPDLLDRVISSERKILEGELTNRSQSDGQRPICWVTFRCCSCGFETINKPKLNIHMRSHSDIIQQALDVPRKTGQVKATLRAGEKHPLSTGTEQPFVPPKVLKTF